MDMKIEETSLEGVLIIHLDPKIDKRGYFLRFWDETILSAYNLPQRWCEESISYSKYKNTLRGLHFQYQPFAQSKFISLIKGYISDVVVNIDLDSPNYGKWQLFELSDKEPLALFIPANYAHGFVTRTEDCYLIYKMDKPYNPLFEDGIIWNDKDLGINWKVSAPILSQRDSGFKTLNEITTKLRMINDK